MCHIYGTCVIYISGMCHIYAAYGTAPAWWMKVPLPRGKPEGASTSACHGWPQFAFSQYLDIPDTPVVYQVLDGEERGLRPATVQSIPTVLFESTPAPK